MLFLESRALVSASSPIPAVLHHPTLTLESLRGRIDGLWRVLEEVTDPRDPRGVRYPLPLLLILALLATTAGAKNFLETAEYSADLPVWLLAELGACSWAGSPSGWTFGRVLGRVDDNELDQALSGWTARDSEPTEAVAIDGKTMRAAVTGQADMPRTQVVAAMNSRGEVLGQTAVDAGDENTAARDLITRLGRKTLEGMVITADAKHTSSAFIAEAEAAGALWLLPVKGNRPATYQRLTTLPWGHARTGTHDRTRGHGRAETRSLKVLALDDDLRPELLNARQAVRIRRWRRPIGKPASIEVVYYLTNLTPADITPADLAKLIRRHWAIENRLHLIRDVAFDEDHHRATVPATHPRTSPSSATPPSPCTAKTAPPASNPPSAPATAGPNDSWASCPKRLKPGRSTLHMPCQP